MRSSYPVRMPITPCRSDRATAIRAGAHRGHRDRHQSAHGRQIQSHVKELGRRKGCFARSGARAAGDRRLGEDRAQGQTPRFPGMRRRRSSGSAPKARSLSSSNRLQATVTGYTPRVTGHFVRSNALQFFCRELVRKVGLDRRREFRPLWFQIGEVAARDEAAPLFGIGLFKRRPNSTSEIETPNACPVALIVHGGGTVSAPAGPPARAGWRRGVAILPLTSTPEYRKMLYRIAGQSYQAGIEAKVHGVVSGRTV